VKREFLSILAAILGLLALSGLPSAAQQKGNPQGPQFLADNALRKPDNYREWVYLSTGKGMSYGPLAQFAGADPPFDNVFVEPSAYQAFLQTGIWPDKTMLVLEMRESQTKGSIVQSGSYQGKLLGVEAEVKDESRFPGKWAFYAWGMSSDPVKPLDTKAPCYACHAQNAAVDNTFVQFYPTLLEVAKKKGTVKAVPAAAAGGSTE